MIHRGLSAFSIVRDIFKGFLDTSQGVLVRVRLFVRGTRSPSTARISKCRGESSGARVVAEGSAFCAGVCSRTIALGL